MDPGWGKDSAATGVGAAFATEFLLWEIHVSDTLSDNLRAWSIGKFVDGTAISVVVPVGSVDSEHLVGEIVPPVTLDVHIASDWEINFLSEVGLPLDRPRGGLGVG